MGIINRGILGGFRKKTGAVVGVRWHGLDVMRGMPRKTSKTPSQAQLDHQMKFRLLSQLLSKVSSVIYIGFADAFAKPTAMNLAMAYNLKHAFDRHSAGVQMDYAGLSFSRGTRALPKAAAVEGSTQGRLVFSWNYQGNQDKQENARDMVTLLLYCPRTNSMLKLLRVATRADPGFTYQLPSGFIGDAVQVYLLMESAKARGTVSNSLYLGEVLVSIN